MPRSRLLHLLLPAVLLLSGPARADTAALRAFVTLHAPVVRLSDLFTHAGRRAHEVLGPGPAPGGRIVVPAAQLAAIAAQYGVRWHPLSPVDRTVLDRPGRPVPRADILATLHAALAQSGAPASFDVTLTGFAPPLVPPAALARPVVEQIDYDPATGRFAAMVGIAAKGMDPLHVPVSGLVRRVVILPVATHTLLAGQVLRPADLRLSPVRAKLQRVPMVRRLQQALGMALRRSVAVGQPLPASDLMRPALVRRGGAVLMLLDGNGLSLTAQGTALQSGAAGDTVRVVNPASHAVLEARVTGPDQVRIAPGSLPLSTPRAMRVAAR